MSSSGQPFNEKISSSEDELLPSTTEHKNETIAIQNMENYNNKPSMILDTKYMEFESKPSSSHLAQMNLYSDIKKVKDCCLIFPGTIKNIIYPLEPIGLNLHILFFDIQAETHYEFKNKCKLFVNSLIDIINSYRVID